MLESLYVNNFAIIEDLKIDFKDRMTVLTGETGAGKSLIIDTISLLLGQRADSDMIRYGKKKATIEGIFSYDNPHINELLIKYGIKIFDKLTINREIFDNSKNVIKLNGANVSLIMLKSIAVYLADIHVQNDTYKLFNSESYLGLLTPADDEKYSRYLQEYTLNLSKYLSAYKKYEHILKGQKESLEKLEFLKFEKEELTSLKLSADIDKELQEEIGKLENYDKIFSSLAEAYENLNNEYFSIDNIYTAASSLKKITDFDSKYQAYQEKLLDSYYVLDEIKSEISEQIRGLDFDQEELNRKIERLNEINKVKSKYNKSVEELLKYLEEITLEIDMVNNYDDVLNENKECVIECHKKLLKSAITLSTYRKNRALEVEKGVINECLDLDLEDTQFKIQFNEHKEFDPFDSSCFLEYGIDTVEFMISFNRGEPLKALHKVASGGEMSRIMLAFKSYFSSQTNFSLMVFDEIDTGVSGATAKKIAKKLKSIATKTQILCITHLPQVASMGDYHIHIYKEVINDRTTTHFKYLSLEERIEEVALMLSGDKLSLYALDHAKALLAENKEI